MDEKGLNEGIVKALLLDHKRDRRWKNIRFFILTFFIILFFVLAFLFSLFSYRHQGD